MSGIATSRMEGVPLLFAASLIYVIAASIECDESNDCTDYRGYAVAVGVISLFITLILLALRAAKQGGMVEKFHPYIALFLFLWWAIGAAIGTFKGPFRTTSNGYFSAWAAFLFSTQYAYASNNAVRNILDKGANTMAGNQQHNTGGETAWQTGGGGEAAGGASTSV